MSDLLQEQRTVARIVRFLERGPAECAEAAASNKLLLQANERGTISVPADILRRLLRDGLVLRDGVRLVLSRDGAALSRRLAAASDPFAEQHREIDLVSIQMPEGPSLAVVNLAESPLAQLVRRRAKDGSPYLTATEFGAGERLRSDYTRGQIMPRMGANWEASVASGRRAGGIADLTDMALAARQRVEKALAAVGPELSGVLVDVCCFLKGLEAVEAERGWPARSAKIVLKSALGVLGRHYNPVAAQRHRQALHWGAPDYRPSIG